MLVNSNSWNNNKRGGCIIFKAYPNSKKFYLITAKHNIFQNEDHLAYAEPTKDISDLEIKVFKEDQDYVKIDYFYKQAFFFKDSENLFYLDLSLIIIDNDFGNLGALKIYDTEDGKQSRHDYCTAGYPSYIENQTQAKNTLMFYYLKPISLHKNNIEQVINEDGSLNFYDDEYDFSGNLRGMSGSGVFLLGKNGEIALRSVIYKAIPTNRFECVKIDDILDQINEKLCELGLASDQIQITSHLLSVNDEIFSLSELAEIENIRKLIESSSQLKIEDIKTPEDIRKKAKSLNKTYITLKQNIDELSYSYAHLALFAHREKMQLARTRFFSKAIELNPNHVTAFSLEKLEYQKNKTIKIKDINELNPTDAIGINKKYRQLLNLENNEANIIKLTKEAIEKLSYLDHTPDTQILIDDFSNKLNNIYNQDKSIKPIFKYQKLADFYHKIPQKYSAALYYNQLALEIINFTNNSIIYKEESEKIEKRITSLNKLTKPLSADELCEIEELAKSISLQEEDQTIKDLLHKLSYEISKLKETNSEQEEIARDIINSLLSLHIQNQNLINHTQDNKINVDIANGNNIEIKTIANSITNLIKSTPEKYEIQIDEKTRNELSLIIEEPNTSLIKTLDKLNEIVDDTKNYISESEKSLNILASHEKDELSNIRQEIKSTLDKLLAQQSLLATEKNEVLSYLKNSEKRMLANIHKLDIDNQRKIEVLDFIKDRINQLNNRVQVITFTQNKNHSTLIKSSNNATEELHKIISICQYLEESLLNSTSDYKNEFKSIKSGQIRIEHTLLTKTVEAISGFQRNQETLTSLTDDHSRLEDILLHKTINTPSKQRVSLRTKVFLVIYCISMFTIAIYFMNKYGLLDLS